MVQSRVRMDADRARLDFYHRVLAIDGPCNSSSVDAGLLVDRDSDRDVCRLSCGSADAPPV